MTASRSGRERRRTVIVVALVTVHVLALAVFLLRTVQAGYLARVLDAREQWRAGNLTGAAALYQNFAEDYPWFSRPLLLFEDYPSRARAWYALGRIEAERGNRDAALHAYREAMHAEAGLGQREYRNLLLEAGMAGVLADDARQRLASHADDLAAWWDLGASELALGHADAAVHAYAAALDHLPAWLSAHTRASSRGSLTAEEGDLRGLLSVALLKAGAVDRSRAECDWLSRRQRADEHFDQLCSAYLLAAAGDSKGAQRRLQGYTPSGPEHRALAAALAGDSGAAAH